MDITKEQWTGQLGNTATAAIFNNLGTTVTPIEVLADMLDAYNKAEALFNSGRTAPPYLNSVSNPTTATIILRQMEVRFSLLLIKLQLQKIWKCQSNGSHLAHNDHLIMKNSPIELNSWLSFFPNQELAEQIRRIVGDDYLQSSEELLFNCLVAYHKAQQAYNLKPDNPSVLETVSNPVFGALTDTTELAVKTQKQSYTVTFVSKIQVTQSTVMGWEKPKTA